MSSPPIYHHHQLQVARSSRRSTVLSLHETGTARLVFTADFNSFNGVLINAQDETFVLQSVTSRSSSIDDDDIDQQQDASTSVDVSIIDAETGNEYIVHNVRLIHTLAQHHTLNNHHHNTIVANTFVQLDSGTLHFRTDEILVGNRADIEISKYMNPTQMITGQSVHIGTMTINVQTSITPPPTPRRESSDDVPMEESDDFLA